MLFPRSRARPSRPLFWGGGASSARTRCGRRPSGVDNPSGLSRHRGRPSHQHTHTRRPAPRRRRRRRTFPPPCRTMTARLVMHSCAILLSARTIHPSSCRHHHHIRRANADVGPVERGDDVDPRLALAHVRRRPRARRSDDAAVLPHQGQSQARGTGTRPREAVVSIDSSRSILTRSLARLARDPGRGRRTTEETTSATGMGRARHRESRARDDRDRAVEEKRGVCRATTRRAAPGSRCDGRTPPVAWSVAHRCRAARFE